MHQLFSLQDFKCHKAAFHLIYKQKLAFSWLNWRFRSSFKKKPSKLSFLSSNQINLSETLESTCLIAWKYQLYIRLPRRRDLSRNVLSTETIFFQDEFQWENYQEYYHAFRSRKRCDWDSTRGSFRTISKNKGLNELIGAIRVVILMVHYSHTRISWPNKVTDTLSWICRQKSITPIIESNY